RAAGSGAQRTRLCDGRRSDRLIGSPTVRKGSASHSHHRGTHMTADTAPPPAIVEPAQPGVPLRAANEVSGLSAPDPSLRSGLVEPDQLRKDLEESRRTLEALRRERQITRALFEAG